MKRTRLPNAPHPGHGRYIYAYHHIRTNQVLYSLTHTLHPTALRQLPDTGANNTPASLRKDHWKPLYTVCLPSSPTNTDSKTGVNAQGLHAFKRLREYKRLHELCWTPPALLSKPWGEKDIEKLREKLEERGGNKKESVYDIIARKKRKMRAGIVMGQKANSVADLAAVLLQQEEMGTRTAEAIEEEKGNDREKEVDYMLALAKEAEEEEGVQKLESQIEAARRRVEDEDVIAVEGQEGKGESKKELKRKLRALETRRKKMLFAVDAVRAARDPAQRPALIAQRNARLALEDQQQQQSSAEPAALLSQPLTYRIRLLWDLAKSANRGGLSALSARIVGAEELLARAVLPDEAIRARNALWGLKLTRKHMELALAVSQREYKTEDLSAEADEVKDQLHQYKVEMIEGEARTGMEGEEGESVHRELESARAALEAFREAKSPVADVDAGVESATFEGEAATSIVSPSSTNTTNSTTASPTTSPHPSSPPSPTPDDEDEESLIRSLLPSFPHRAPSHSTTSNLPKRGPIRAKLRRLSRPTFSTEGIVVKWTNQLDAEFAAEWPQDVKHEPLGWTKFTAPKGQEGRVDDMESFKARMWKGRGVNWVERGSEDGEEGVQDGGLGRMDGEMERVRRRDMVEEVKRRVLRRVAGEELEEGEVGMPVAMEDVGAGSVEARGNDDVAVEEGTSDGQAPPRLSV